MITVYRSNSRDSMVFSDISGDLVVTIRRLSDAESDLAVILERGYNSRKNFDAMSDQISWVDALGPWHLPDQNSLELSLYHGSWKGLRYYRR
ncbi:hypothetical protein ACFL2Q_04685 [Thermodesulfobacteriota bacterium]